MEITSRDQEVVAKSALPSNRHPSTIWVSFLSYSGDNTGHGNVILEYTTDTSKELSRVVRMSSKGVFAKELQCALKVNEEHTFVLYRLEDASARLLKIDGVQFTKSKWGKSLIHFSLDLMAISQSIALSSTGKVTQTIFSAEGCSVTFEASIVDPSMEECEEVSSIASVRDEIYETEELVPLSGGQEISDLDSKCSSQTSEDERKGLRVRFNRKIRTIPSTQQLQEEIQQAVEERSKLSTNVGELSMQLFQMKHEMRDIKEALRQVTDLFAMESRKLDIRITKDSRGGITKRRRVVLDGNGIALAYGGGTFRTEGIEIALDYYVSRDISVVAVVSERKVFEISEPSHSSRQVHERERLKHLIDRGLVSVSPSQTKRGVYMVKYALDQDADVISIDNFRSVVDMQTSKAEQKRVRSFLESHRIPFAFIGDKFVPNGSSSPSYPSSHASKIVERCDTM